MKRRRFLVVDDSLAVVKHLTLILESLGHEVVGSAKIGIEAVEMAARLTPDAITMDIQMPEMDGLEATKRNLTDWSSPAPTVQRILAVSSLSAIRWVPQVP